MRPEFSALRFQDFEKAEGNLRRLEQQLAPTLLAPLASLLANSPDPDRALNLLERYALAAAPEVLGDLARFAAALSYLVAIFSYSGFLAETLLSEPGLVVQFARDRNFTKLKSKEDLMQDFARFATTSPDPWLAAQLARFKRRNYLRIVLKDVLGLATLGETTLELSALADTLLTNALVYCDRELETRYGQPQHRDAQGRIVRSAFSIVSLGKLGGNELNYSSDIDLLFLYSHDGETAGGSERDSSITNKEYFVRLAHAITRTITQATPQGQVFRVDLRLRPEGEQGDLAIALKSALEYYEHRARDWELQMLIKARHSAGDPRVTRDFLRGVDSEVHRSPGDFAAVESVLWAREKISEKIRQSRGQVIDVKLHRGGIRDIEFLVQCLQRLHGRHDPWVRSGGTLLALRKLNDKGWLSDSDYARLTTAYEFLRRVEHRMQLERGQQTHRLPADPARGGTLDRLARCAGIEGGAADSPGSALLHRLREGFAQVDEIYERMIHPHGAPSALGAAFELKPLSALTPYLGRASYDSTLKFLDIQAPDMARWVREAALPERSHKNVTRLFAALLASAERFALLREKPECVRQALRIVGASQYLAELLIYHPEDLVVLEPEEAGASLQAPAAQMEIGLGETRGLEPVPWALAKGLEMRDKMALLRTHYRAGILRLAAADLAGGSSPFAVLRRWSASAARSVATALAIAQVAPGEPPLNPLPSPAAAGSELALNEVKGQALGKEGTEGWSPERGSGPQGGAEASFPWPFVVLGLGRLGLSEFDLASDADLVFVVGPEVPREELGFWTRLAEKTIEVLSSYTRDGTVFAVDTRLRPRGQEGELVVTQDALLGYVAESAQVWEALTYLKACPIAGHPQLGREIVARLAGAVLDRFSVYPNLEAELRQMRRRLEREVTVPPSNTKTAPGGYYDVDFAVSFLRLRHRMTQPPGANLAEQIAALRASGLISDEDASALSSGAGFLRSVDHAIRLVTGKATVGLPEHVGDAEAVENLVRRWGLLGEREGLAPRLRETQQQLRYVYRRLVGS
jgi:glutamate-ammonia-ligase adenylyltransferase